jgi:CBS domain-containing protein
MDQALLQRLDAFPYRHRVAELMRPPLSLPGETLLGDAARALTGDHRSSVLLLDAEGRPAGIVTEQDVVRLVGGEGPAALRLSLAAIATRPVLTVPADAFLYLALGRMDRLDVRHLVAVDAAGRAVGTLSARSVLHSRLSSAYSLGDGIAAATDGAGLRAAHERLPRLAAGLLAEGLAAGQVAEVVSAVNRDLAARAVALAAGAVERARGQAPAAWAFLVLGSAGRGESLLAPDQDNALVHDGEETRDDAWFQALGEGAADLLDAAGVPYCKGGVMASKPAWRHTLAGWGRLIESWTRAPAPEKLLSIDIFYDFVPVAGDLALAGRLGELARQAAMQPLLASVMAGQVARPAPPLRLFGGFRTQGGRLDLKLNGLYPLVAGARVLALADGVAERGTLARLAAARAAGRLNDSDHDNWVADLQLFQDLILRQQVADLAAGRAPGSRVAVEGLPAGRQQALKAALRRVASTVDTVVDAVAQVSGIGRKQA